MLFVLNPSLVLRVAFGLAFIVSAAAVTFASPTSTAEYVRLGGLISAAASAAIFLVTLKPILKIVHIATFGEQWWFPWLDGEWIGEIRSNWPLVSALMDSAAGNAPKFDALAEHPPGLEPILIIPARLQIESGLLQIHIRLYVLDSENRSYSIIVKPEWTRPLPPKLHYIFKQSTGDPVPPTDASSHMGAGIVEYDATTKELHGQYWTNRQRERGLNTAGSLKFVRKHA